ncbi:hypothetical protein Br6_05014 [Rhodococcus sp. Br-6]|nr:hypothetical protein Br6_05014 [Rhodococcus sp. Br-6]
MCDDCGRVVSVVGGYCRDCAVHHPEATQLWARIDEREKRARAQREAGQARWAAEAEERRRAALTPEERRREDTQKRRQTALAVAVACYLAICAVGTVVFVVLNIGTIITWLIGIALVLSVLAVIWFVLSRGIFFISW